MNYIDERKTKLIDKFNKNDKQKGVDKYLSNIGFTYFTTALIILCGILFGMGSAFNYIFSINTYIPNRICKNIIVNFEIYVPNDDYEMYHEYCEYFKDNRNYDCRDVEFQPYNLIGKLNLECDTNLKNKVAILGVSFNIGMALASISFGYFADKYGRKIILILGTCLFTICLTIIYFTTDYYTFLIIYFILGFSGELLHTPVFVLASEYVSKDRTDMVSLLINIFDNLGGVFVAITYYLLEDLDRLIILYILRSVISLIIIMYVLVESPYFYNYQKDYAQCSNSLSYLSKYSNINNIELLNNIDVQNIIFEDDKIVKEDKNHSNINFYLVIMVILSSIIWIIVETSFYYMFFYAKYFPTNIYVTIVLENIASIVGFSIAYYLINLLGKKITLFSSFSIIIFISIIYNYFKSYEYILYFLISLQIMLASINIMILYVFPTLYFNNDIIGRVFSICAFFGKIGVIIAPILSEYYPPYIILSGLNIFGILLIYFLRRQIHYNT